MQTVRAQGISFIAIAFFCVKATLLDSPNQRSLLRSEGVSKLQKEVEHDDAKDEAIQKQVEIFQQKETIRADERRLKSDLQKLHDAHNMDLRGKIKNIGRWLRESEQLSKDALQDFKRLEADEQVLLKAQEEAQKLRHAHLILDNVISNQEDPRERRVPHNAESSHRHYENAATGKQKIIMTEISGSGNMGMSHDGQAFEEISSVPALLPLNGNFEHGKPGEMPPFWNKPYAAEAGGSLPSAMLSHEQYRNGTMSLEFTPNSFVISGNEAESFFELEEGNQYKLTFHALARSKSGTGAGDLVTEFLVFARSTDKAFRRALKTQGSLPQKLHKVHVGNEWQEFSHTFIADESSLRVRLLMGCATGTVWVDDMSFMQVCPDNICFKDADGAKTQITGSYRRKSHGKYGQPIYQHENGQYLYYWPEFGRWLVGSDYNSNSSIVQSLNSGLSGCPSTAAGTRWSVWDDGRWVHPHMWVGDCLEDPSALKLISQ